MIFNICLCILINRTEKLLLLSNKQFSLKHNNQFLNLLTLVQRLADISLESSLLTHENLFWRKQLIIGWTCSIFEIIIINHYWFIKTIQVIIFLQYLNYILVCIIIKMLSKLILISETIYKNNLSPCGTTWSY